MTVTSKDNQWVKEWRRLNDSAKYRRETGLFAIEGARLCGDALRSGVALQAVLYTGSAQVSLTLGGLLVQDVRLVGMATDRLAGLAQLETLLRTAVRLNLRHSFVLLNWFV